MSATRQSKAASKWRAPILFAILALLFIAEGSFPSAMFSGSWNISLSLLNLGLISAVVALGINIQWGYAGLFNVGAVGFLALGGLAPVLIAVDPVPGAFAAGGWGILGALAIAAVTVIAAVVLWRKLSPGALRAIAIAALLVAGLFAFRAVFDPAVQAIEAIQPSKYGNIGGLGLPVLLSWPVGAAFAAAAAWGVGKVTLGLRSDYLAIATLGIGEIIVAVLKNEVWLARGVNNVSGIPRPVAYEVDLQADPEFVSRAAAWGFEAAEASGIWVKLSYVALFAAVLLGVVVLAELAQRSPWGRMMRAIRDNEEAAEAMGKNVTGRHLQVFILGSALIGLAGAMLITFDGLMAPNGYNPLRYTFLIWVMVIVGGSGNNWGAILGAILIWFIWIKAEIWGPDVMALVTSVLSDGELKERLIKGAPHMRYVAMGLVMLFVLRFAPRGLIPER